MMAHRYFLWSFDDGVTIESDPIMTADRAVRMIRSARRQPSQYDVRRVAPGVIRLAHRASGEVGTIYTSKRAARLAGGR